jgi:FkbM family methyltransferase
VAVGEDVGVCEIVPYSPDPTNVGAQKVVAGSGNIPMVKLDTFEYENIGCIKIDVEGFETQVLKGAINTIDEHSPLLYIEAWDNKALRDVMNILTPLGYAPRQRFNATPTYLITR